MFDTKKTLIVVYKDELLMKVPYLQEQLELMCRKTKRKMPKITISDIEYR